MKIKSTGLLVGRWQPLHNGHLEMINQSAAAVDLLYLGVGSINKRDEKNPFSAAERQLMIQNSVTPEVQKKLKVFFVPDFADDKKWMECVGYLVPKYDVAFSSDNKMSALYASFGKNVQRIKLLRRDILSGTNMRALLLEGKDISQHVPKGTRDVIAMKNSSDLIGLLQKR
ncbi:MAG TPA: adenylyltransferase/cytidyltransferase family protein [Candidatus Aquilonibacter sp.]|nr:adenylyltransferase/cytidyltransferase family protein [Candidatus Aquilonibacter sp.]